MERIFIRKIIFSALCVSEGEISNALWAAVPVESLSENRIQDLEAEYEIKSGIFLFQARYHSVSDFPFTLALLYPCILDLLRFSWEPPRPYQIVVSISWPGSYKLLWEIGRLDTQKLIFPGSSNVCFWILNTLGTPETTVQRLLTHGAVNFLEDIAFAADWKSEFNCWEKSVDRHFFSPIDTFFSPERQVDLPISLNL